MHPISPPIITATSNIERGSSTKKYAKTAVTNPVDYMILTETETGIKVIDKKVQSMAKYPKTLRLIKE